MRRLVQAFRLSILVKRDRFPAEERNVPDREGGLADGFQSKRQRIAIKTLMGP